MEITREYPDRPILAVGALVLQKDEILLVRRRYEPSAGKWSIPGGLVELGETISSAAKREVKEEVGLDVELERIVDVIDNIVRDDRDKVRFHYVLVDYLAKPLNYEIRLNSESLDAEWVKISEIRRYKITHTLSRLLGKLGFISFEIEKT